MLMPTCERIAVVGPPGAGKTYTARLLAAATGLPLIDLDDIYWGTGWRRPTEAEWMRRHRAATERPCWIIAGNFQRLIPDRLDRATHLVVMDPGPLVCVGRLLHRTLSIYLGNLDALPQAMRRSGRWNAHKGIRHLIMLNLRYRNRLLPATCAVANRRGVQVIITGRKTTIRAILCELQTAAADVGGC